MGMFRRAAHRIEYHSTGVYFVLPAYRQLPAADRQLVLVAARPAVNNGGLRRSWIHGVCVCVRLPSSNLIVLYLK